jgi:hypothetical protein
VRRNPSVILVREWEGQMSSSGCCGRLEGDFLSSDGCPVFEERRANMNAMGPLYRAIRERFGDSVEIEVVDPRSFLSLLALLVHDFRAFHVGIGEAFRTLTHLPVQGVVVNGRLVAQGEWPDASEILDRLEQAFAEARPAPGTSN